MFVINQLLAIAEDLRQLHKLLAEELPDVWGAIGLPEAQLTEHIRVPINLHGHIGDHLQFSGAELIDHQLVTRFIRNVN